MNSESSATEPHYAEFEAHPRPRLVDVSGAAAYLGRTPSAIRNMIHAKKLKPVRIDGRVYLDLRDLDTMIEQAKEQ